MSNGEVVINRKGRKEKEIKDWISRNECFRGKSRGLRRGLRKRGRNQENEITAH